MGVRQHFSGVYGRDNLIYGTYKAEGAERILGAYKLEGAILVDDSRAQCRKWRETSRCFWVGSAQGLSRADLQHIARGGTDC